MRTTYRMMGLVVGLLWAAGCSSPVTNAPVTNAGTEQSADDPEQCDNPPQTLTGNLAEGDPCDDFSECAPACCACTNDGLQYLAAECFQGYCANAGDACSDTLGPDLCP